MKLFRGWFLADRPDVLGLLRHQAAVTVAGMKAFAEWSATGSDELARAVRDAEHEADDARLAVLEALSAALTTPVEQEDLYALSERLDAVLNLAKNVVREAEVLSVGPDEHAAAMGALARDGVEHLARAFDELGREHDQAGAHADAAIKSSRGIEHHYRKALAALPDDADVKTTLLKHDVYRGYTVIADAIARVATRTRYALLKDV